MKKRLVLVLICFVLIFLVGCKEESNLIALEEAIGDLQSRLEEVEKENDSLKSTVTLLELDKADLLTEIEQLTETLEAMDEENGRNTTAVVFRPFSSSIASKVSVNCSISVNKSALSNSKRVTVDFKESFSFSTSSNLLCKSPIASSKAIKFDSSLHPTKNIKTKHIKTNTNLFFIIILHTLL